MAPPREKIIFRGFLMTSVFSPTSPYSTPTYASKGTTSQSTASNTGSTSKTQADSATNITLSDAAKSAAAGTPKDFSAVIDDARAEITKLLLAASATSAYKDGKPTIDLSGLDRREVFAAASNAGGHFTEDEQKLATAEFQRRFDSAMAGPTGVARVTGNFNGLYQAAADYYDAMSDEEKAAEGWKEQRAAIETGLKETAADPTQARKDIPNDPVANYLQRLTEGSAGVPRDFGDVGKDARAALDAQYAKAKASGTTIVFDARRAQRGQMVDLSMLDNRALSAITLNQNDKFSPNEIRAANNELRARNGASILASFKLDDKGADLTAFSQSIIGQYASMSDEERQAAGWTPELYNSAVANYQTSSKLSSLLSQLGASASPADSTGIASLTGSSDSGGSMSGGLLSYL
jgi:hypothetical protein